MIWEPQGEASQVASGYLHFVPIPLRDLRRKRSGTRERSPNVSRLSNSLLKTVPFLTEPLKPLKHKPFMELCQNERSCDCNRVPNPVAFPVAIKCLQLDLLQSLTGLRS